MQADLIAPTLPDYRLLDSGEGAKLELLAGRLVQRPAVAALWPRRLPAAAWDEAVSVCTRTSDGGATWLHREPCPVELPFAWQGPQGAMRLRLRLTAFGHCGAFFEQEPLWRLIQEHLAGRAGARFLNLFGYTGAATLAAAAVGAEVDHVDSAKGALDWGREHQAASGLAEAAIRWVHADVMQWCGLRAKRGWCYDCIFADPPAYGRGRDKGEDWRIERDLARLLAALVPALNPGGLLILAAHAPGVQRAALVNCCMGCGEVKAGELGLGHANDARVLPAGVYVTLNR